MSYFVIRDAKGVILDKRYPSRMDAQKTIDIRARASAYARMFWYVEEINTQVTITTNPPH